MLEVLTSIPGIQWPAIPNARASQLLAMQFQLEQSQWLPPAELQRLQARQVGILYKHAYDHVPFYRRRFDEVGLPPPRLLSVNDWLRVPLLSRRDIQNAGVEMHCKPPVAAHGPILPIFTSGSSGQPVGTLTTTVTRLFTSALQLRQHLWHKRDVSLKMATIRSLDGAEGTSNTERSSDLWGLGTTDVVATGPSVALDVHASIEDQAEFLLKHDPDYLLIYPSVVLALAGHFAKSTRKLTKLREIRTFGELLEPKVREACRRVWGVKVVDAYSSQELALIATQCPEFEHYHVHAENLIVEVLDDEGTPCAPGQTGRLVITALHNFAMPLIRYDIGDYGELGGICPCGRGLPVLQRIVGRQRNMFTLPGGRKVWPALELTLDEQTGALPPIHQFQLVQRTIDLVEFLVVAPRVFTEPELGKIRELVDRALGCRLNLKITYVKEIARGATGKYEDFRSEVETP